ncbi:MAG TPA: hypothetical protein PK448_05455 [Bacteroidales bacterium]|nr:hypothetical protein [Bacteroidales bacterium]
MREGAAGKPAKEGALKSKEKKSDFRSSFFDYALFIAPSCGLVTGRRPRA